MEVPSATSGTSNSTSATKSAGMSVDYEMFLQLLIAQMKNQDPTNPTDSSEYMSQLAQISSVEQAVQTNTKLDTLLSSNALSQAESLIGRTVKFVADGSTEATTGTIASVSIISGGAVANLSDGTSVFLGPGVTIS